MKTPLGNRGAPSQTTVRILGAAGAVLITAGVATVFAFSSSLARRLPHETWFAIPFVVAVVILIFVVQWLVRRSDL